jgi:hypothetical protein
MNLFDRVKNIITSPNREWDVIASEQPDAGKIVTGYVLPLAGLAAIAAFIGYGLIGFSAFGFRINGINWGLYYALTVLLGAIVSVFRNWLMEKVWQNRKNQDCNPRTRCGIQRSVKSTQPKQ